VGRVRIVYVTNAITLRTRIVSVIEIFQQQHFEIIVNFMIQRHSA
jgi:hypothetical protein